jgi:hypothetical protein
VPECDNVILFDRMCGLTEYVQSKGRARRENSRFIVIGTREEKASYYELLSLEEKLMRLIPTMMNSKLMFDKILSSQIALLDSSDNSNRKRLPMKHAKQKVTKFSLHIYFEDTNYNFGKLASSLKKCKGFLESETSKKSLSNLQLFEKTKTLRCVLELKSKYETFRLEEIKYILQTIRFLIDDCAFNILINYIPLKTKSPTMANLQVMCEEFELGNLITPFLFGKQQPTPFCKANFIIQFEIKSILVLCFVEEILYKFEISFDSIDQFIVLSDNEESFDVYVPTKRPPFVYSLLKGRDQHITADNLNNADEEYLDWERVCQENLNSSFHFKFATKDKALVMKSLKAITKQHLFFTNVKSTSISYSIDEFRNGFKRRTFPINYSFECFISQCYYFINGKITQKFVKLLNDLSIEILGAVLEKLTLNLSKFRYCDILNVLVAIISETYSSESIFTDIEKAATVLVRRVTVCPSRIIFHFPEPNSSNRVIRKYGEENFIRVRFRDEDLNKLNMSQRFSDMGKLYAKIWTFLLDGLNISGVKYDFLAMSSSQMRGLYIFKNFNRLKRGLALS